MHTTSRPATKPHINIFSRLACDHESTFDPASSLLTLVEYLSSNFSSQYSCTLNHPEQVTTMNWDLIFQWIWRLTHKNCTNGSSDDVPNDCISSAMKINPQRPVGPIRLHNILYNWLPQTHSTWQTLVKSCTRMVWECLRCTRMACKINCNSLHKFYGYASPLDWRFASPVAQKSGPSLGPKESRAAQ